MLTWNVEVLSRPQSIDADAVEFVALFAAEMSRSAERFLAASAKEDVSEPLRLCRRMRGAAAVYGFSSFAERLWSVEILIQAGEMRPSAVADEIMLVANRIGRFARESVNER